MGPIGFKDSRMMYYAGNITGVLNRGYTKRCLQSGSDRRGLLSPCRIDANAFYSWRAVTPRNARFTRVALLERSSRDLRILLECATKFVHATESYLGERIRVTAGIVSNVCSQSRKDRVLFVIKPLIPCVSGLTFNRMCSELQLSFQYQRRIEKYRLNFNVDPVTSSYIPRKGNRF